MQPSVSFWEAEINQFNSQYPWWGSAMALPSRMIYLSPSLRLENLLPIYRRVFSGLLLFHLFSICAYLWQTQTAFAGSLFDSLPSLPLLSGVILFLIPVHSILLGAGCHVHCLMKSPTLVRSLWCAAWMILHASISNWHAFFGTGWFIYLSPV